MFGIGFFELLVIAVLGLLVFGPEKLPEAIRTFAFGFTKAKRAWQSTRRELEQELGMDEIRREIHNAQVMEEIKKIESKTQSILDDPEKLTDKDSLESSLFDKDSPNYIDKNSSAPEASDKEADNHEPKDQ